MDISELKRYKIKKVESGTSFWVFSKLPKEVLPNVFMKTIANSIDILIVLLIRTLVFTFFIGLVFASEITSMARKVASISSGASLSEMFSVVAGSSGGAGMLFAVIVSFLSGMGYYLYCWTRKNPATIGQMLTKIRVIRYSVYAREEVMVSPSLARLIGFYCGSLVQYILFCLLVGMMFAHQFNFVLIVVAIIWLLWTDSGLIAKRRSIYEVLTDITLIRNR